MNPENPEEALNAMRKAAENNPIPDEALEILRRWREENARSLPKWKIITTFTPGAVPESEHARAE